MNSSGEKLYRIKCFRSILNQSRLKFCVPPPRVIWGKCICCSTYTGHRVAVPSWVGATFQHKELWTDLKLFIIVLIFSKEVHSLWKSIIGGRQFLQFRIGYFYQPWERCITVNLFGKSKVPLSWGKILLLCIGKEFSCSHSQSTLLLSFWSCCLHLPPTTNLDQKWQEKLLAKGVRVRVKE